MIQLDLLNVGIVDDTDAILLVMRSRALHKLLVIETGLLEGQAVALEVSGIRAERPLTQDLLHDVILTLGATIREVRIDAFRDQTFFAKLILSRLDGGVQTLEVDARPSDAIAVAVTCDPRLPIYVAEEVLEDVTGQP